MEYKSIIDDDGNTEFPQLGVNVKILVIVGFPCLAGAQYKLSLSEGHDTVGVLKSLHGIGKDEKGRPLTVELVVETADGETVTIQRNANIQGLKTIMVENIK
jgi:hypothetical protein